eukprot:TRINITY_DN16444_c0_g1_i1.p1 TRINITY_DN16444_c0_g1~~TRINITY_DN16444_c0_g1_i1.p1  ORF type:complete len:2545 (+),score=828.78 TRINITY_DN16444_c0_g1_i1:100-7734(+)
MSGSARVRCFDELRAALAERVSDGAPGLPEDFARILAAPRRFWRDETWIGAIAKGDGVWEAWKEEEASIRHDNEEVVKWVETLAKLAGVNGSAAQKLAILCCPVHADYITPVLRDCMYTSFTDTSFTTQVLEFYLRERLAVVRAASHVVSAAAACRADGDAAALMPCVEKLAARRGHTLACLSGSKPVGVDAVPGVRLDLYPSDRAHQRTLEHIAHLEFLVCLNYAEGPLDGAAVLKDLHEVLGADAPGSFRQTLARHRSALPCQLSGGRCRTVLTAWLSQCLTALSPLPSGKSCKDVLGEAVHSFLLALDGPEAALVHLVMWCLDYRDTGPPSHAVVCAGLATLRYLVTGVYAPPQLTDQPDAVPVLDFSAFSYVTGPYKHIGRAVLKLLVGVLNPSRATEKHLLLLSRAAVACREVRDGSDTGHGQLLDQLVKQAGWLFPSCVATTALLELVAADVPSQQEHWWQCLSTLDKVAIDYPYDGAALGCDMATMGHDPAQRARAMLPTEATLGEVITLPRDADGVHRVPAGFGNDWFAPMAPLPTAKHVDEAINCQNLSRALTAGQPAAQHVVTVWELPEAVNGWQWMLMRILHVVKLGRRTEPSEQWVVGYLELVRAAIALMHTMVCGDEPANEFAHFTSCGMRRLHELQTHLRRLQAELGCSGEAPWTIPLILGEVLASLVTWQEARCYVVRAGVVQQCSLMLGSLLRVSRTIRSQGGAELHVAGPVLTAFRSLFLPGKQSTRAPLLHLFWVVEASNKSCTCTLAVVGILRELLANPEDYCEIAQDLPDITCYISEVITDLSHQWYHSSHEQWLLTQHCLAALVDAMNHTALPRSLPGLGGVGAAGSAKAFSTVQHILHHERMSRALATIIGSVTAAAFDRNTAQRGPPAHLSARVLHLALQALEHALVACEELQRARQPLPKLVEILCEPDALVSLKMVDKYSLPGMLFQNAAFAPDDQTKVQAMRTFSLLCAIADNGSLLRHIGYRAGSTGRTLLSWIDPTTSAGSWTKIDLKAIEDPEVQYACKHGMLHPSTDDAAMPSIFRARPDVHEAWLEASLSTCRFLALLRMMQSMVAHQPQLFMQTFLDQGASMADPIGTLLRTFVGDDSYVEPRPMVTEAVLALLVAGLQAKEPCRSRILARTSATLAVKIVVDSPGIGDLLAGREARGCPWDRMPVLSEAVLAPVREVLGETTGGALSDPCLLFDGSRSWTQCGFVRRSADVVEGPLSFVVGGISSHPEPQQREKILRAIATAAKQSFKDAGFATLELTATAWFAARGRLISDPQVWPIVAEALHNSRSDLARWMAASPAERGGEAAGDLTLRGRGGDAAMAGEHGDAATVHRAGEMSWHILISAHALRALAVVESLRLVFPPKKHTDPLSPLHETAQLVAAVHTCVVRVLGKWGDTRWEESSTAGVLGMLVQSDHPVDGMKLDGVLGQACGLFYGDVKVPVLPSYFGSAGRSDAGGSVRAGDTPRLRQAPFRSTPLGGAYGARPTPSPRRPGTADSGSPRFVSPLMRPAFADTPTWDAGNQAAGGPASAFPTTPLDMEVPGMAGMGAAAAFEFESLIPVADGPSEQITLYEMLRKAEAEVLLALNDTGVGAELAPPGCPEDAAAAAALDALRACGGATLETCGVAPAAAAQMPGAYINLRFIEAGYASCTRLIRCCAELNDVVALAAAAFSMLKSVVQLISVLLRSPCPFSSSQVPTMMLPTPALLNPSDWRHGRQSSLVYVVLQQCLLYPPHDASGDRDLAPSPLVSFLDSAIRSEACQLLADVVSECCCRSDLVAEGRLEPSERPFAGPNDRYFVRRHIVWQILEVLQGAHAIKDDNDVGLGQQRSRQGASRAGEADLLLALCLLGRPEGVPFKAEGGGGSSTLPAALFPHLHQYLALRDFATATQSDLDCYRTAFIALHTFGVPQGQERHAVQLTRTLLQHLGALHRGLEGELASRNRMLLHVVGAPGAHQGAFACAAGGAKLQEVLDRGSLILQGLRSIAASPTGAAVFAEAEVVPFLASLHLFHPPAPRSDVGGAAAVPPPRGRHPRDGGEAHAAPWSALWLGVLSTLSAAAIPPPIDGRKRAALPAFTAQVETFVGHMQQRLEYLLSYQGLRRDLSEETVRSLQLVACIARARLAHSTPVSAASPVFPWLLPLLRHAIEAVKACLDAPIAGATGPGDAATTAPVGGDGGALPAAGAAEPLDMQTLCYVFDAASQILSILRLHIVSFLPVASPVGTAGLASPAVRRLLEALEIALEVKGATQISHVQAAAAAALNAPEPRLRELVEAAGYPFSADRPPKPHQLKHLRDAILQECAPYWTPSAVSQELFVTSQRQMLFDVVAIFGTDDNLSVPGKVVIDLMDAVCAKVGALLEADTEQHPKRRDAKLTSAVKAATCAIEQAAVLRQCYVACLELCAPTEAQALWAGNVLQRILNEKTVLHLTTIPGSVLRKRLIVPLAQLAQLGKADEAQRVQAALALHCIDELRRQPEVTPWLDRPCQALHAATRAAAARGDVQSAKLEKLVKSSVELLCKLNRDCYGTSIDLSSK